MTDYQLPEKEDFVMTYFKRKREKKWKRFWGRPKPWLLIGLGLGLLLGIVFLLPLVAAL